MFFYIFNYVSIIGMTVLVSCDIYCYCCKGKFFLQPWTNVLINRYLMVFDKVLLVVRTKNVETINELGIYNIPVDESKVEVLPMPFFQGLKQYVKVYRTVKKNAQIAAKRCDVAILRLPSTVAFEVWRALKKVGKKYICEIVFDCYDAYKSASGIEKLLWKLMHKWQVEACHNAIGVACVTARYLQQRYYPIMKNAVVTNYSSIELPLSFYYKERMHPKKNDITIVHVANQVQFAGRKGHNELIRVLNIVKEAGYNVRLIFIGRDYLGGIQKLQDYAAKYKVDSIVTFTGFLSKEELRNTMLHADIAVLPTRAEGLPRVVIEAMALGLPCITSPVSGNSELVDGDLLIGYNDIIGMANMIIRLICDSAFYEEISKRNFERSKKYCSDILNQRRTEFFKSVKSLVEESR